MPQVPLTQASYTARSIIADAQRCVNLFPEKNPDDANAPFSFYPTPGLRLLTNVPSDGGVRGMFTASNGHVYVVCGSGLYYYTAWNDFIPVGSITPGVTTPVSMVDNGTQMILVDGQPNGGWLIDLPTNAFAPIDDVNWPGAADRVGYVDTFTVMNKPGTQDFYSTLSNTMEFDPLYFAAKTGYSDYLQTILVMHREIWLMGTTTTEVWYDAGNPNFPFAILPGVFIQQGCIAKYSAATHDLLTFWLGQTLDGKGVVMMGVSYEAKRISTHAIEFAIGQYSTISDAVGFTYQQEGHVYYVLSFPTAGATWVYDVNVQLWHERAYVDDDGVEGRWRVNCVTNAYGMLIGGDWEDGRIYAVDLDYYLDDTQPIVRRKGFPHLIREGDKVTYQRFRADMEAGEAPDSMAEAPTVYLRWSDDRGKTWGHPMGQTLGMEGNYLVQPQWWRLGMARDRVFELFWSSSQKSALNGAWVLSKPTGA